MKKILLFILLLAPAISFCQLTKDEQIWLKQSENDLWKISYGYVPIDKAEGLFNSKISYNETIFTEWQNYLADCNELVADTIKQSGKVNCELVPVKLNGKITSYNTVPRDTVWEEAECDQYKYYSNSIFSSINGTVLWSNSLSTDYGRVVGNVGIGYLSPEPAKNYFYISRNKVCMIKKRKASFEDFFERWCVEKKLIELN